MSEEKQVLPEKSAKWSKKKIALAILLAVFVLAASLFQFAAGKVRQAAEQALLVRANEAVNGRVTAGSIDLSILGQVEARQVQVLDAAGKQLAKSERVLIGYRWADLLHSQLGPQAVTDVTVEKPEIWLDYAQERLNWDGLMKAKADETAGFRGAVAVKDGKLHLHTAYFTKTVDQVAGKVDCGQADQFGLDASGKVDQSPLKLTGQWGVPGASVLTVTAQGLDLVKLGLTEAEDPIQLTKGQLNELTVQLAKNAAGVTALQGLSGRFSAVDTAGVVVLTQGSSRFEKQGSVIQFTDASALYKGQSAAAAGQVTVTPAGEKTMQFAIQMPAGDPAALLPGLPANGPLAVQATLAGSVLSPVLDGSFSLPGLQFGDLAVTGIDGTFSYAGKTMKLLSATGAAAGGSVSASGDVYPDTERYVLAISGSGLDSSRLTKKDVQGPLSLTGTASGDATAAVAQGSFQIQNGKAYGVSFRKLTGDFVKRGSADAEVSNLAIQTELGIFYPEQLSQDVLERLHEKNLPVTKEALKQKIEQEVTDKLLQKIFR